ncbi:MAG: nucleotidyltransferase domain-containing protein [Deltaproteobacteria bacterium]|nr:nucleotidyltransferase domain-containing protein [Deltaproteobacteria bacterium]
MTISQSVLQVLAERILHVARVRRIIVFGSAATGAMTRDSDIDILVIVSDGARNLRDLRVSIRDALRGLGYPIDVFVMEEERFEESKDVIGGLAYPANKYGRVIHEAA